MRELPALPGEGGVRKIDRKRGFLHSFCRHGFFASLFSLSFLLFRRATGIDIIPHSRLLRVFASRGLTRKSERDKAGISFPWI